MSVLAKLAWFKAAKAGGRGTSKNKAGAEISTAPKQRRETTAGCVLGLPLPSQKANQIVACRRNFLTPTSIIIQYNVMIL